MDEGDNAGGCWVCGRSLFGVSVGVKSAMN